MRQREAAATCCRFGRHHPALPHIGQGRRTSLAHIVRIRVVQHSLARPASRCMTAARLEWPLGYTCAAQIATLTDAKRTGTTTMGILIKAPTRRREPSLATVSTDGVPESTAGALHIREVVRMTGLRREQLY